LILSGLNRNLFNTDEFDLSPENSGVYIAKENIRVFISEYEKKINTTSRYLSHVDYDLSYRMALLHQASQLCKAIENEDASIYEPVIIR
jgi:CRISPR-associated protein Cas1